MMGASFGWMWDGRSKGKAPSSAIGSDCGRRVIASNWVENERGPGGTKILAGERCTQVLLRGQRNARFGMRLSDFDLKSIPGAFLRFFLVANDKH